MKYKLTSKGYIPLSEEELLEIEQRQIEWQEDSDNRTSEKVRKQRDELLYRSDWTQVADAPVDQSAWATYRQALRDIPSQAGFPNDVNFPTEP